MHNYDFSWEETCHSDGNNDRYHETCHAHSDGTSRSYTHENTGEDSYQGSYCHSTPESGECCTTFQGWFDGVEHQYEETPDANCNSDGGYHEDPHLELHEALLEVGEVADMCGCGPTDGLANQADHNGFVYDGEGNAAHCQTVCWYGDNIIGLGAEHGFIPNPWA